MVGALAVAVTMIVIMTLSEPVLNPPRLLLVLGSVVRPLRLLVDDVYIGWSRLPAASTGPAC